MPNTENPFAPKRAAAAGNPFAASAPAADPTPAPSDPFAGTPKNELRELLLLAALLRDRKAELVKIIDAERAEVAARIIQLSGGLTGKHEVGDLTYTLRRPSERRSTDYGLLKSAYPEAYAATVKVTEPAEDALPTLVLGKGFTR